MPKITISDQLKDVYIFFKKNNDNIYRPFTIKDFIFWTTINFLIGELILSTPNRLIQNIGLIYKTDHVYYGELFFVFLAIVISPILEELLFRYPLKFLPKNIKLRNSGIFILSLIFALIHVTSYEIKESYKLLSIFIISLSPFYGGIILSYIRLSYGLRYSILIHFSYNILALAYFHLLSYI